MEETTRLGGNRRSPSTNSSGEGKKEAFFTGEGERDTGLSFLTEGGGESSFLQNPEAKASPFQRKEGDPPQPFFWAGRGGY